MFKIHIFKIKEEEMMNIGLLLWGNIKYKIQSLPEVQTIVSIWNFFYDFDKEKFVTITFTCRSSFLCLKIIVVQGDMNSAKGDTSIFMYSKYSLLWIVISLFTPHEFNDTQKINNEIWNFMDTTKFQLLLNF